MSSFGRHLRVIWMDGGSARRADAGLSVDVRALDEAAREGRWGDVARCYEGPVLDGVRDDGSHRFEAWSAAECRRCERNSLPAWASECGRLDALGQTSAVVALAERWLAAAATSPDAAHALLSALAAGTAHARWLAESAYHDRAERLAAESETRPDPSVTRVAAMITARIAAPSTPARENPRSGADAPLGRLAAR